MGPWPATLHSCRAGGERNVSSIARQTENIAYKFSGFTLDANSGALLAMDGTELPLRPKSFALLLLLVENAGRVVSKELIMASVWPSVFVTENNITQCVHEIRCALGTEAQRILRTRPRRGYLIAADVVGIPAERGFHRSVAWL